MSLPILPSLQGGFSLIWSGDSAMQPRPPDLGGDPTDEAKDTRTEEQKAWDESYKSCAESGRWDRLLKPGAAPTVFKFELPKGEDRRALMDEFLSNVIGGRQAVAASRLFRSTLKDITGDWPGPKLTFVQVDGRDLVSNDVVAFIDERASPRVIGEFAFHISERMKGVPGK